MSQLLSQLSGNWSVSLKMLALFTVGMTVMSAALGEFVSGDWIDL